MYITASFCDTFIKLNNENTPNPCSSETEEPASDTNLPLSHTRYTFSQQQEWVGGHILFYFQHYLNRALEQNEKRMSNEYSVTTLAVLSRVEFQFLCELREN